MTSIPNPLPATWLAYFRTFTDIPYAEEIAIEVNAANAFNSDVPVEDKARRVIQVLAPRFEQRFKSVTNLIRLRGTKQILELAAGLSPRGSLLTDDPVVEYIETDLQAEIEKKKQVVASVLLKANNQRSNLKFAPVDVFSDYIHLAAAAAQLTGPITVVIEGLLSSPNIDLEQKRQVTQNIHHLLASTGGVWITPDFPTGEEREQSYGDAGADISFQSASKHSFKSEDEINTFFAEAGFSIENFYQKELAGEITSIQRLQLNPEAQALRLSNMKIHCLTPQ